MYSIMFLNTENRIMDNIFMGLLLFYIHYIHYILDYYALLVCIDSYYAPIVMLI